MDSLVGCGLAGPHGEQPLGAENTIFYSGRVWAAFQPWRNFKDVFRESTFTAGTVKLAEDAAPIPSRNLDEVSSVFGFVPDFGKDRRERDKLRLIGEVKNAMDILLAKKFRRPFEAL